VDVGGESLTHKAMTHSTGVERSHWGLESLGSSVSEMNLDLHRKSTSRTLNDLQSK